MVVEKDQPNPFVITHLGSVSTDALLEELASRYGVSAHELHNKLAVAIWQLELEAVKRPNPLEPIAVNGGNNSNHITK